MKTPDNIKKGLEGLKCIANAGRIDDALTLIQRQEADLDTLRKFTVELSARNEELHKENLTLALRVKQLEAERDAAVEDIKEAHDAYCGCVTCKNYKVNADCQEPPDTFCPNCPHDNCPCKGCSSNLENWQWRGVQKEG